MSVTDANNLIRSMWLALCDAYIPPSLLVQWAELGEQAWNECSNGLLMRKLLERICPREEFRVLQAVPDDSEAWRDTGYMVRRLEPCPTVWAILSSLPTRGYSVQH